MVDETREQAFERLGADHIRIALNSGNLPSEWTGDAIRWLADHDRSERSRREASQASQERITLIDSEDARSARREARAAIIIAAIGIIIMLLAWLYPRK